MKNKMKFSALLFALALSGSLLTGCSMDMHGPHIPGVTPSGGNGGNGGGNSGEVTGEKYFVTYTASADYTVSGLVSTGYLKDAPVSFTVEPTHPEDKEVRQVIARAGTSDLSITNSGSTYSFTMPEKDVKLTIQMKNIDKYTLSYSGELIAEETITFSLKLGSSPYTGDFDVEGKTDADKAKINVKEDHQVYLKSEGDVIVVAKVDNAVVAELSLTVAPSTQMTIAEAFEDAFETTKFNGSSGNSSAKSKKSYVVGGKILGISPYDDKGNASVLIDDGSQALTVMVNSSANKPFDVVVGDSTKLTVKFTNYYGMFEAIHPSSSDTKLYSFYPDQIVKVEKEYSKTYLSTPENMSAEQYLEYVTLAEKNSDKDKASEQGLTPIKYVNLAVTYDEEHKMDGTKGELVGGYLIDGAVKSDKKYAINTTLKPNGLDTGNGHKSTLSGFMVGVNTNYCTSKMWVMKQTPLAPESVTISGGETLTVYQNNPKQLEYTTEQAGSYGVASWSSSDPGVVAVDENGVVSYVSAGTATITIKMDGKDTVTDTIVVTADSTVAHADSVELGENVDLVYPCEPYQITATTSPALITDPFVWASSDKTVATVDENGLVTILKPGTTTISLTIGDLSDSVIVTVKAQTLKDLSTAQSGTAVDTYGYYAGAYADGKYGYWLYDGAYGLVVNSNARPEGVEAGKIVHVVGTIAKYYGARQVTLTSHEVVSDHEGLSAQQKLVYDGTADFTQADQGRLASLTGVVKSVSGTADITYEITVGNKTVKIYLSKNNVVTTAYNDFVNKVKEGRTVTVEAYVSARTGSQNDEPSSVAADKYQLINPKVIGDPILPDATGITLDHTTASVKQGKTLQLKASILPVGAESTVTWTSSGNVKVTVDQTGLVTVAEDAPIGAENKATITAKITLKDSTEKTATCEITVLDKNTKVEETVEKTSAELRAENNWTESAGSSVGTKFSSFDLVEGAVKIEFTGTGNTATYWTSGSEIRIYTDGTKPATIKVSAYDGYEIVSFKMVFSLSNGSSATFDLTSDTLDEINAASKTYTLTKTGSSNPQVKITKFVVTYKEK